MVQRLIGAVLCVLLCAPAAGGELSRRVAEVRVEGNRVMRTDVLVRATGVRTGQVWSEQVGAEAVRQVLSAYQEQGYWHAGVAYVTKRRGADKVVVRIEVAEGEATTVGAVSFEGEIPEPIALMQAIPELTAGSVLRRSHVAADAEALMTYLERTGYPFASVEPDVRVRPGVYTVNVVWRIASGPRVSVDGVRFSGRTATSEDVLARETGLVIGQTYDQRAVDAATNGLRRLSWLRSVADPVIERDVRSGRYVIHYAIEEEKATTVEGGLGVLPAADGSYGWVGRLHFASDNLAGSGREAQVLWDRPDVGSSDLGVRYREPWMLGQPVHGSVGVTFEQRPGYIASGLAFGLGYSPATRLDVEAIVERSSVRPDTVGSSVVQRERVWSVGGEMTWDGRDDRYLPRRGMRVVSRVVWDRVRGVNERDTRIRYRVETDGYRAMGRRTVLGLKVSGAGLFQGHTPGPNALVRVGGATTIRGYLEERFLVEHAAWTNVQLMRDMGRGARAYAFVDAGLLKGTRDSGAGWVEAVGYGVGLQAETRSGMMTVEYGLSREDSPGKGKVHVGLVGAW